MREARLLALGLFEGSAFDLYEARLEPNTRAMFAAENPARRGATPKLPDSYFDSFETSKYRSGNPVQRYLIRQFMEKVVTLFDQTAPASSVLELGCGEGFVSGQLSTRRPLETYVGVDPNAVDLANLRAKFPQVQTQQGSIYDLSFLDRKFDLVVCAEVLEHLDDPGRALEQIVSVSPSWVILSVPHEPWFCLSNLARAKNVRRFGNDEEHVNLWSRAAFARTIEPYLHIESHTSSYPWQLVLATPK